MKIYRNGQEFELTYEELRAAFLEMDKIYRLEDAEQQFLSYIEYEEYGSDQAWIDEFSAKYGFTPEAAIDPQSESFILQKLQDDFECSQSCDIPENDLWREIIDVTLRKFASLKRAADLHGPMLNESHMLPPELVCMNSGLEARYELIQRYSNPDIVYHCVTEDGSDAFVSIDKMTGITVKTNMCNGWIKEMRYDPKGRFEGSRSAGKWQKSTSATNGISVKAIPNELSLNFGDAEARRTMIRLYGAKGSAFSGINEDGENVVVSIVDSGICVRTNQSNGWIRVNYYDVDGNACGETFDGKWKESHIAHREGA